MQLPGLALSSLVASTPYADVHRATRLHDGARVRVELLRTADPAVAARLVAASAALRRADGRHLVRVRQVLEEPLGLVRDDVPAEAVDGVDPVRVVADALDALAGLHALGLAHGALTAQDLLLDGSVPLRPVVRVTGWGLVGLFSDVPPEAADDVRDAGRVLEQLAGALPPEAAPMVVADPALRPTAAQARDVLRRLQGRPAAPAPVAVRRAPAAAHAAPRAPRRPLRLLGLGLASLAVLGIGVAGGRLLANGDPEPQPRAQAAEPPSAGPYVLPALTGPGGLVVERTWLLEQGGAVLRGTTVVRNPTLQVVTAHVDEVVPTAIAAGVDDLVFTPAPDQVLERDAIVRFEVRSLPPAGAMTWTFVAQLPQAVQRDVLPRLAAAADAVRAGHERAPAPGGPWPTPTS